MTDVLEGAFGSESYDRESGSILHRRAAGESVYITYRWVEQHSFAAGRRGERVENASRKTLADHPRGTAVRRARTSQEAHSATSDEPAGRIQAATGAAQLAPELGWPAPGQGRPGRGVQRRRASRNAKINVLVRLPRILSPYSQSSGRTEM